MASILSINRTYILDVCEGEKEPVISLTELLGLSIINFIVPYVYIALKNRIDQCWKFIKSSYIRPSYIRSKKLFYEKCSICDEDFPDYEQSILTCGHVFHIPCYKSYFESHIYSYKCPKCRARQTLTEG